MTVIDTTSAPTEIEKLNPQARPEKAAGRMMESTKMGKAKSLDTSNTEHDPVVTEQLKPLNSASDAAGLGTSAPATPAPAPAEALPPADQPAADPADIFTDLAALRKQTVITVRKGKSILPPIRIVHRPTPNVYFQVSPDEDMKLECNLVVDGGGDEGSKKTFYFVTPAMRWHPKLTSRVRPYVMRVIITTGGQFMLWPVPVIQKGKGGAVRVWETYNRAAEAAEKGWVLMQWSEDIRDYIIDPPEGALPPPAKIERTMSAMLKERFEGCIINSEEHEFMLQLRGIS
jgi:hypothetical protein